MGVNLIRFGVAMDEGLLDEFDASIERRGYKTRSEALRDLVRADLSEQQLRAGGFAVGTLTIVYDHHVRELTERLTAMQHDLGEAVVSTLHVHLDHDRCLEVIVMRGRADVIRSACDALVATKGVLQGKVVLTALNAAPGTATVGGAGPNDVRGLAYRGGGPTTHTHGGKRHTHGR